MIYVTDDFFVNTIFKGMCTSQQTLATLVLLRTFQSIYILSTCHNGLFYRNKVAAGVISPIQLAIW